VLPEASRQDPWLYVLLWELLGLEQKVWWENEATVLVPATCGVVDKCCISKGTRKACVAGLSLNSCKVSSTRCLQILI
jgi:hypothetical protein